MVIDTSALVAIVLAEPTRDFLLEAIRAATTRIVSSVSVYEAGKTVIRSPGGPLAVLKLYGLLEDLGIETAVFDEAQAKAAVGAFARFGKGMGHPAQLNFGDCAVLRPGRPSRRTLACHRQRFRRHRHHGPAAVKLPMRRNLLRWRLIEG